MHYEATGEREFTADYGKGEVEAVHPGPFVTPPIVTKPEISISLEPVLTENEKELVLAALAVEPSLSFSLGKLSELKDLKGWTYSMMRRKAETWEKMGLLTPGCANEKTGQWEPRQMTDELIQLAK